jgi:SAM-dependent methyltransferase
MFLRKSSIAREPLAVTMSGVRMGERLLQLNAPDARLAAMLAAKPGMSGHSAIVISNERDADRARAAVAESGVLVDVTTTSLDALPFENDAFDVVVMHNAAGTLAPLDAAMRTRALSDCRRVLRAGGRIVALEPGARTGLSALLHPAPGIDASYESAGGTVAALEAAGFRQVRLLADREGMRFVEGRRG